MQGVILGSRSRDYLPRGVDIAQVQTEAGICVQAAVYVWVYADVGQKIARAGPTNSTTGSPLSSGSQEIADMKFSG